MSDNENPTQDEPLTFTAPTLPRPSAAPSSDVGVNSDTVDVTEMDAAAFDAHNETTESAPVQVEGDSGSDNATDADSAEPTADVEVYDVNEDDVQGNDSPTIPPAPVSETGNLSLTLTRPPGLPSRPTGLPLQPPAGLPQRPVGLPTQPPPALPPQAPLGAAPVLPTAAPEQQAQMAMNAYVSAGALTANQLLTGRQDQFAHLDDKILQVREWVQDYITNNNMANDVAAARADTSLRAAMAAMLDRLILQYISKETVVRGADRQTLIASVIHEILGLGPIEPLWSDPRITEVMVNGPNSVFAEIGGTVVKVPGCRFRDQAHLLEVCQQILMPLNRRIDQKNPLEDGRLPDGSRVNIVHQACAPSGPLLTIRRFPETVWTLKDLVKNGSLDEAMACELAWLIYYKCSTVVVGGTGSGKTSLLNAMSSCIPRGERVVTVEDSLELRLHPDSHVAAMEGRPPSPNGEGEISIRRLVKNALRMRPDRVVVGEVRDGSALDMLQAMNTGHEGSLTTVHANGAEEAVNRLAVLVAQGSDIPDDKVAWLIGDAVDLMVVQRRYEDGSRRVSGIYEVPSMNQSEDGRLHPIPLWEWEQSGTDEDHHVVGQYVKKNDISAHLRRLRRLDNYAKFTMADVDRMSELPEHMSKGD